LDFVQVILHLTVIQTSSPDRLGMRWL